MREGEEEEEEEEEEQKQQQHLHSHLPFWLIWRNCDKQLIR
jgi:hypothetical protein